MEYVLLSNNPDVIQKAKEERWLEVKEVPGGVKEVLREALALLYRGYKMISHPLMGSIKPWENPYRSILLGKIPKPLPGRMILLLDRTIQKLEEREKAGLVVTEGSYPEKVLADFRFLDGELIRQTIDRIRETAI